MLDFGKYQRKEIKMSELIDGLGHSDLYRLTNEMIDTFLEIVAGCEDTDVTFEPVDPHAYDGAAATEEEITMPWTLGHIIVHTTASAEEAAAIATELARGVPFRGGRSRSEVPWMTVTTMAMCQQRLEESRRMRLASLDMWPDKPYLTNTMENHRGEEVHAKGSFMSGLTHEFSHIDHLKDVVHQAKKSRIG